MTVAIAENMRLLFGLRLALGDDRPLPYAVSMAVRAGIVRYPSTASNAIRKLVAFGVIEEAGSLPPIKPRREGTKLYRPPSLEGTADD